MDRELLLEIGVEEMPASWLPALTAQLAARLDGAPDRRRPAGARAPSRRTRTPRRLTACLPELVDRQEDRDETVMGPPVSARRSTPKAIRRTPGSASRASSARISTRSSRWTRRRASTCRTSGTFAAARRSTCCRTCSAGCCATCTFPKQMHWDAQLEDDKGEFLVRPADPLAAVPLRRPRRAVHDRATGAGVEPARAGRDVGRRDLRPPVPRDERPRRPRDQGAQLRRVPQEARPRTS